MLQRGNLWKTRRFNPPILLLASFHPLSRTRVRIIVRFNWTDVTGLRGRGGWRWGNGGIPCARGSRFLGAFGEIFSESGIYRKRSNVLERFHCTALLFVLKVGNLDDPGFRHGFVVVERYCKWKLHLLEHCWYWLLSNGSDSSLDALNRRNHNVTEWCLFFMY